MIAVIGRRRKNRLQVNHRHAEILQVVKTLRRSESTKVANARRDRTDHVIVRIAPRNRHDLIDHFIRMRTRDRWKWRSKNRRSQQHRSESNKSSKGHGSEPNPRTANLRTCCASFTRIHRSTGPLRSRYAVIHQHATNQRPFKKRPQALAVGCVHRGYCAPRCSKSIFARGHRARPWNRARHPRHHRMDETVQDSFQMVDSSMRGPPRIPTRSQ